MKISASRNIKLFINLQTSLATVATKHATTTVKNKHQVPMKCDLIGGLSNGPGQVSEPRTKSQTIPNSIETCLKSSCMCMTLVGAWRFNFQKHCLVNGLMEYGIRVLLFMGGRLLEYMLFLYVCVDIFERAK